MPELPDLTVYIEALEARVIGEPLTGIRVANPFTLRTAMPPVDALLDRRVEGIRRIGKQIVIALEEEYFVVVHLMIAGRLRWQSPSAKIPARLGLVAFDFTEGTLVLTEAGKKRRASVHLVHGEPSLMQFDKGGIDVLSCSLAQFMEALGRENHTLKRSLTDQRFLSVIGNAYSDEILHRAGISPMRQIRHLTHDQWEGLYSACRQVLSDWIDRLRQETGDRFPGKVTAFHPEMAVHGRYKEPCPDCGKPVQRIRYASNEANYCAQCQNQGNLLADRSLSRLLKTDWPKTLEELEESSR